ncbi:hypothetical protein [Nonomuraea sp. NPDC048916]|uniref:hypothetical protein n=1 Tax=Nonomuraea sp. NPDC048916 TaxID=3154232 RepID=UPI0033DCFD45
MRKVLRWAVLPLAMAALASAALPAAAATTTATTTTTYEIELISLTCNKKQTTVGKDRPYLNIDGTREFGPVEMGKGDTESLVGRTHQFSGTSAVMELFEEDSGVDDFLGSVIVNDTESGAGVQIDEFDHLNGAKYTIVYEVNPA